MTNKDVLIACIKDAPTTGEFASYMENGVEYGDALLKVGFKSFTVGTTRWFVFKPTMNKLNWIMNFVFPLYKVPYGNIKSDIRIHSGFLAGYMSIRNDVLNLVWNDSGIDNYIFCGHSLGGALARIAAVDTQYNFKKDIVVYTLGAPNIGNRAFEYSYNKRIKHSIYYTNTGDPVPHIPPELVGYKRYVRTPLPGKLQWDFWNNHQPGVYITNLNNRDTSEEIL